VDAGQDRREISSASANAFDIVGRDAERTAVHSFIDNAGGRPAALVLEGEPGIGKSTLWLAAADYAAASGCRVLTARPAEAERALAHAGLSDLLESVLDETLAALPLPRRRALEVAMLRTETDGEAVDERALAVAVRDVLQHVAGDGPLVIAVDDVQWLDISSSYALAFAVRRLAGCDVRLVLARRSGDDTHSFRVEEALPAGDIARVGVGPVSVGALHQILRNRLNRQFARQTLLRIHERAGGNPFFALELARALAEEVDPLEPLPVPQTLEDLLRARIADLPAATCDALALAAAVGTPSESLLRRAGIDAGVLEPAVVAQVIEPGPGAIRFTHPLLSSVLYRDLGAKRRSVHGRLADYVDDPLQRARHLALAQDEPDAAVAAALDRAVTQAAGRGASAAAAELAEHAVRLTPPTAHDERRRRALAAARAHQMAGEWTRARAMAGDLLSEVDVGSWRAEALVLLSELGSVERATALLEEALREAASRPALQSLIHCRLAWVTRFDASFDHAAAALRLADELGDEVLRTRARAVQAILGWFAGTAPTPSDLPTLAPHLADALGGERLVQEATQAIANTFAPASKRAAARSMLEREHRRWRDHDEPRSARALWGLAWLEFWAGEWARAAEHAARAHDVAIQYGLEVPQDHLPIAVIAVHRGQLELAREHSQRALRLAEEQFGFHPPQHIAVLALVALWSGNAEAACTKFDEASRRAATLGWGEPSLRWWVPDYVELLLELGRGDDAARLLDTWEADATRVEREVVLAHATRCRGLLAAARGDVDGALVLLTRAVTEHDAVGDPFGGARARLALGVAGRRARQKRSARQSLEDAMEAFESVGAAGWAAKARAELGRIGGRKTESGLTAAERRVALLVADGRTNREVATALFLGERTVASHLTHVYAKLGVRSRTELARHLQPEDAD
jgi:DNA-binding CsgD family transcriptional regulator